MSHQLKILALACGLAFTGSVLAVAPLEGRTITGAHVDAYDASAVMIYDPNAHLTWLRDWNVNSYGVWENQVIWAGSLNVGAFANWSLPTSLNQDGSGPCFGLNCTDSQMGYLWYEVLGNTEGSFTNAGPFQNMQSDDYWSGTVSAPALEPDEAWYFRPGDGSQYSVPLVLGMAARAVAVRPGDVTVPIPEPQTWAMLLMGLGAVGFLARRRQS